MLSDGILHRSNCCLFRQLIGHHQICGGIFQLVYQVTISVYCKNSRGLEGGGCRRRRRRRHCTATAAVLPVLDRGKTIKTTFVTSRQLCRYFSSQLYLQAKQRLLFRCYKKLWLGSWNTIAWDFFNIIYAGLVLIVWLGLIRKIITTAVLIYETFSVY